MAKKRVVITGMGTVNPVGNNVKETFDNLVNGVNGIDYIKNFDTSDLKVKVGGEIKNLDFEDYIDKRTIRRSDRVMILALIGAIQAYQDSGLKEDDYDLFRFGNYISSGIGGIETIERESKVLNERGPDRISPFFIPNTIINLAAGLVGMHFKLKGPIVPIVTACSTGTNGIGEAFRAIRDGYIDLAFAGGSEASLNLTGVGAFQALRALSTSDNPNRASIPFDKDRDGFVMGEGSGILIIESLEHAQKRGAKIYAEIVGYGNTSDGHHLTAPEPEALGMRRAMEDAISEAGIKPEDIDYINAHGTSTQLNDEIETFAIKQVFKDASEKVNISSTKSMTGHLLGATGALETIVCVEAINNGIIPPTINYINPDPKCDLNYTPNKAVKRDVDVTMNLNLGFGGQNACLILRRFK